MEKYSHQVRKNSHNYVPNQTKQPRIHNGTKDKENFYQNGKVTTPERRQETTPLNQHDGNPGHTTLEMEKAAEEIDGAHQLLVRKNPDKHPLEPKARSYPHVWGELIRNPRKGIVPAGVTLVTVVAILSLMRKGLDSTDNITNTHSPTDTNNDSDDTSPTYRDTTSSKQQSQHETPSSTQPSVLNHAQQYSEGSHPISTEYVMTGPATDFTTGSAAYGNEANNDGGVTNGDNDDDVTIEDDVENTTDQFQTRPPILSNNNEENFQVDEPESRTIYSTQAASFQVNANGQKYTDVTWQVKEPGKKYFQDIPDSHTTKLVVFGNSAQSGAQYRAVFTLESGDKIPTEEAKLYITPNLNTDPNKVFIETGPTFDGGIIIRGSEVDLHARGVPKDYNVKWHRLPPNSTQWEEINDDNTYSGSETTDLTINSLGTQAENNGCRYGVVLIPQEPSHRSKRDVILASTSFFIAYGLASAGYNAGARLAEKTNDDEPTKPDPRSINGIVGEEPSGDPDAVPGDHYYSVDVSPGAVVKFNQGKNLYVENFDNGVEVTYSLDGKNYHKWHNGLWGFLEFGPKIRRGWILGLGRFFQSLKGEVHVFTNTIFRIRVKDNEWSKDGSDRKGNYHYNYITFNANGVTEGQVNATLSPNNKVITRDIKYGQTLRLDGTVSMPEKGVKVQYARTLNPTEKTKWTPVLSSENEINMPGIKIELTPTNQTSSSEPLPPNTRLYTINAEIGAPQPMTLKIGNNVIKIPMSAPRTTTTTPSATTTTTTTSTTTTSRRPPPPEMPPSVKSFTDKVKGGSIENFQYWESVYRRVPGFQQQRTAYQRAVREYEQQWGKVSS